MSLKPIATISLVLLSASCTLTQPKPAPVEDAAGGRMAVIRNGEALLQLGLKQYDEGQYRRAVATLQQAVELPLTREKRILAHKHLAFIHCMFNRASRCRDQFQKAIEIDPNFTLAPAEIGHPQWGSVYKSLRSRQTTP